MVGSEPWSILKEGNQDTWDIVVLHHLVNDWHRERFSVVRDESNHTEAGDHAAPFDLLEVSILVALHICCHVFHADWLAWEKVFILTESSALFSQVDELSIAVVNQLDEDVLTANTGCPMVKHHFEEVAH